jgi:hypothetical protein
MDIPRDFFMDGTQFINRCTKGTIFFPPGLSSGLSQGGRQLLRIGHETTINESACANFFYSGPPRIYKDPPPPQAVGVGFLVMGAVGYLVKLS